MKALRVGLIGCGHISRAHLNGWKRARPGAVTGVFDVDPDRARNRAREFGVPNVYDSVAELLAETDVADICTPPQTHAELLRQALDATVDVLIEKPVVTDLAQWDELRPEIVSTDRRLAVVHNLKFTTMIDRVKSWIDRGRIGAVLRLDWRFLTSPETDRMLSGKPHWSHDLPGGRWFETLPHNLYLTHYLVGPLELDTVSILKTRAGAAAGSTAGEACVVLKSDSVLAAIHYSAGCRVNRREATVVGTDGVIEVDLLGGSASLSGIRDGRGTRIAGRSLMEAGARLVRGAARRPSYLVRRALGEAPHARIIREFDRHLRGSGPLPTPLDEIDYVIRNCDHIGRALDAGMASTG